MEPRDEALVPALLRSESDAGRDPTQARGQVPLDLHAGTHVDLAEARGHRGPESVDDVRVAKHVPGEGDTAAPHDCEEDIDERPRRPSEDREAEGRERRCGNREAREPDREGRIGEPRGWEEGQDEQGDSDETDWGLWVPDTEEDEDMSRSQDEELVNHEQAEERGRGADGW